MIEGERPLPKESLQPPEPPKEASSFFTREVQVPPENLPPITFLYFGHAVEHVDKILKEIKDADLILIEQVGETPGVREREEASRNLILSPEFGRLQEEREFISTLLASGKSSLVLLGRLAGSGKRIKFIDVPSTHPAFETSRKADEAGDRVRRELGRDLRQAYQNFHLQTDLTTQSYKERENYVFQQLSDLTTELKERGSQDIRKVAVLQGPGHTSVHHRFKKTFPEAQVHYKTEGPLLVHTPYNALIRRGLLFPDQEIPEIEYQRGFLAKAVFYPSAFLRFMNTESDDKRAYEKALRFAQNLSGHLSPQEVKEVFEDYEKNLKDRQVMERLGQGGEIGDSQKVIALKTSNHVTSKWAQQKGLELPQPQETT